MDAAVPFYGLPQEGLCQPQNIKVPVQLHFGRLDQFKGFSDPDVSDAAGAAAGAQGQSVSWSVCIAGQRAFGDAFWAEGMQYRTVTGSTDVGW